MHPSNPLMQSQWNFVSIQLIQIAGSGSQLLKEFSEQSWTPWPFCNQDSILHLYYIVFFIFFFEFLRSIPHLQSSDFLFCRRIQYSPTTLGIDNVIARIFKDLGHRVLNPCLLLKIYHLHCGVHVVQNLRISNQNFTYYPHPINKLKWKTTIPINLYGYPLNQKYCKKLLGIFIHFRFIYEFYNVLHFLWVWGSSPIREKCNSSKGLFSSNQ